jgi:transposase-like protein
MDWTQTIALGGTLIAYMTGMCVFFHRLSERGIDKVEKTIVEWRSEHKDQMQKIDARLEKNEAHWREMFMYMNERFDKVKEK